MHTFICKNFLNSQANQANYRVFILFVVELIMNYMFEKYNQKTYICLIELHLLASWGSNWETPQTTRTLLHYGLSRGPRLGPHYDERSGCGEFSYDL